MKKRILCAIFALISAVCFTACGNGDNPSTGGSDGESDGEVTQPVYETATDYPEYADVDLSDYTVYYFDAAAGDDENDGLSEENPKKSISAANRVISKVKKGTPTAIYFKAGSVYESVLNVGRFTASENKPLVIGSYGATAENAYPVFKGTPSCIEVTAGNVRISGLEITNPEAIRGIYAYTVQSGAIQNVVLSNNYLHDINFDFEAGLPKNLQGKGIMPQDIEDITAPETKLSVAAVCPTDRYTYSNSAIYFDAPTLKSQGPSWFENVWVDGNKIERVSRDALFVTSNWVKRPGIDWGVNDYVSDDEGWYPHKNFNVVNNHVEYTGGDGMVVLGTKGGYMSHNTLYHAQLLGRGGYYNAGLWVHSCVDYVIQYNEAAYTHKQNGAGDGQGFDIDIGNRNITFQYNYSHHNQGGGILLCTAGGEFAARDENGDYIYDDKYNLPVLEYKVIWENVTIRNNVFADNDGAVFTHSDALKNLSIVNNTIILKGESGSEKITDANGFFSDVLNKNFKITNNVFYLRNKRNISFDVAYAPDLSVENNLFYNFNDKILDNVNAKNTCYIDPGFEGVQAEKGLEKAAAFKVKNAEILRLGKYLEKMNALDYAGENAQNKNYIGAFSTTK